jgi:hypothetical protein
VEVQCGLMAPLETVVMGAAGMPAKLEHKRRAHDHTQQRTSSKAECVASSVPDRTMPPPALTGGKDLTTDIRPAATAGRAAPAKGKGRVAPVKRKSRGTRKSGDMKDGGKKPMSLTSNSNGNSNGNGNGNKRARTSAKPAISNTQRGEAKSPTDPALVKEVRAYMKANKVSQVVAGQEARVSQAVISQWLSMKYHGHNDKVDGVMREWLESRRAGQVIMPDPDAKTSCLRPARSTTLREKLEKGMLPAGSQLWSSSAATPVQERLLELKTSEAYLLPDGATPQGALHGGAAKGRKPVAAAKRAGEDDAVNAIPCKKPALASPMPWVSPTGQAAVHILQNMLGGPGLVNAGPSPGASPLAPSGVTLMAPPSSAKRDAARSDGVPDLLSPGTANATELLRQLSKPVDTVSPPSLLGGNETNLSVSPGSMGGSSTSASAGQPPPQGAVPTEFWMQGCV